MENFTNTNLFPKCDSFSRCSWKAKLATVPAADSCCFDRKVIIWARPFVHQDRWWKKSHLKITHQTHAHTHTHTHTESNTSNTHTLSLSLNTNTLHTHFHPKHMFSHQTHTHTPSLPTHPHIQTHTQQTLLLVLSQNAMFHNSDKTH